MIGVPLLSEKRFVEKVVIVEVVRLVGEVLDGEDDDDGGGGVGGEDDVQIVRIGDDHHPLKDSKEEWQG